MHMTSRSTNLNLNSVSSYFSPLRQLRLSYYSRSSAASRDGPAPRSSPSFAPYWRALCAVFPAQWSASCHLAPCAPAVLAKADAHVARLTRLLPGTTLCAPAPVLSRLNCSRSHANANRSRSNANRSTRSYHLLLNPCPARRQNS